MTYYILHNNQGELIGVSNTELPKTLLFDVSIIQVDDKIPDLNKVIWNKDTLSFYSNVVVLTKLEFMSRFTTEERVAIQNSTDVIVQDALRLLNLAEFIDLTDQRTIDAVSYFAYIGLLSSNRMSEVLNASY